MWIPQETLLEHFVIKFPHIKDAGSCHAYGITSRELYTNIVNAMGFSVHLRETQKPPYDFRKQTAFSYINKYGTQGLYVGWNNSWVDNQLYPDFDPKYPIVLFGSISRNSWRQLCTYMRMQGWIK